MPIPSPPHCVSVVKSYVELNSNKVLQQQQLPTMGKNMNLEQIVVTIYNIHVR